MASGPQQVVGSSGIAIDIDRQLSILHLQAAEKRVIRVPSAKNIQFLKPSNCCLRNSSDPFSSPCFGQLAGHCHEPPRCSSPRDQLQRRGLSLIDSTVLSTAATSLLGTAAPHHIHIICPRSWKFTR